MSKTWAVYFSATGTTKKIVTCIADRIALFKRLFEMINSRFAPWPLAQYKAASNTALPQPSCQQKYQILTLIFF